MPPNPAEPLPPSISQVLSPFVWVFLAAFLTGLVATPIMRRLALRIGMVDMPDRKRKAHTTPVALLGGMAIFLAWVAGVAASYFIKAPAQVVFPIPVLFGAAIIVTIGLIDDVHHISPRVKMGGQLLAAGILAYQDLGIRLAAEMGRIVGLPVPPDPVSVNPLYLSQLSSQGPGIVLLAVAVYAVGAIVLGFFVVGGCNALNLLDGLDGLAAGCTAISCIGFLFIAVQASIMIVGQHPDVQGSVAISDPVRIVMCLAILGAVLGFLPYNFNPATIFMGDAGSLLLGFLCVATILLFAHTAASGPKFVMAALIVFAVPITDTTLAIVRRKARGQPLFSPDNQHLHHLLARLWQRRGLSPNTTVKMAVLSMYLLSIVFSVLGCAMVFPRWRYALVVFVVLFSFIIVAAFKVGHIQAQVAQPDPAPPSSPPDSAPLPPAHAAHTPTDPTPPGMP